MHPTDSHRLNASIADATGAVTESKSAPPTLGGSRGVWVLIVAIVGSGMNFIDGTAVNVALPTIGRELGGDAAGLQWVIEGFSLTLSALVLIGGALGDRFGRRLVFTIGMTIFTFASLGCALAPSLVVLNVARVVQGVGAALATPGSLALIGAAFKGEARGRAIGTWSGFGVIAGAIGPVLGGWLAQTASWRDVFLINVPLGIFVIVAAIVRVSESRDEDLASSVDWLGAALATAALGALTFGLIDLQGTHGASTGVTSIVAGIVLFAAFAFRETHAAAPMVPLDIFRNRTFAGSNLYTLLLYAALGGSMYFVPFDLQNVQGYSPTAAGAAGLPFILVMALASRWSGGLVARVGPRVPLVVGASFAALAFLAYARIGVGGSYWTTFFPAAVLLGIGGAFFVAPLTTTVMDALDPALAGTASGVNNAVSRVAGLLAIAALGIALVATFYASFDRRVAKLGLSPAAMATVTRERGTLATGKAPQALAAADRSRVQSTQRDAYVSGFRVVMLGSTVLCVLAALTALLTLGRSATPAKPGAA